jgi:hypothetical protein
MPALNSIRRTFDRSLESAKVLFEVAATYSQVPARSIMGEPPIRPGQAQRIAGLSFLVMVRAWEELVEGCLVRYLAGARSPSGYKPSIKRPASRNLIESYERLGSNEYRLGGGKGYLAVSDWSRVRHCATDFFDDGQPFTNVKHQQVQQLKAATVIRNRVAHSSLTARRAFLEVVDTHNELDDRRPRGYSVGHLLLQVGNRGFGKQARRQAFFLHYHDNFVAMAEVICPTGTPPTHRGARQS